MGDAAVSALVKEVVGRLTSELIKEFGLLRGLEEDISILKEDFKLNEAFLEDAEEKHGKEKAVVLWLKSLRSAIMKVENVLDDISTEALLQRLYKERGIKYRVRAFFSSNHNQLMFRLRIAHKVKAIKTKLDAIKSKRSELDLDGIKSKTPKTLLGAISHVDDVGVEGEMPDRETSSLIHDSSIIFGRNEEMEMIAKIICNKEIGKYDNSEIRVYCIWGMGGLGKTTLAQLVYNHETVNTYFELKCWIYVSEKFQVKEIIKKIIESIDNHGCTLTLLDKLQESLKSKLSGKKFLIVLDDVWIESDENEKSRWEELRKILSYGAKESIVVMTTRSQTTSRMMAKVPELQHELGCLSEEESWLLFKKLSFAEGREGDDICELEPIGREIVKKCKGLPLAVKTLGSLMWAKKSTSDWQHVKDNNIWELDEIKVFPAILKLSYDNLLPHLKRCFAFCCLFPKGYEMEKDVVIQLWVVNGFIPPREGKDLYTIGEEILNCFVWRSFFQVVKDKFYSRGMDKYKMHDLMYDMARHVMGDDCLVIEPGKEVKIPNEVLHLSSSCPDEEFPFSSEDLGKLTSLKSIFMFGNIDMPGEELDKLQEEYKFSNVFTQVYLRVLYLTVIELKTFPESIFKLKHLKYLNLSHSSMESLPKSIMYLQNLQVLLLSSCKRLRKLPESICKIKHLKYLTLSGSGISVLPEGLRNMRNLQRLDLNSCYGLMYLPLGIKELTGLRVLSKFPLSKKSGAKIGELGDLNLLEGELVIQGLEIVGGLSEAKTANLKCKTNLSVMTLYWSYSSDRESKPEMFTHCEEVLQGLEPNQCLKELKLLNYIGRIVSSSWIVRLRNLVVIDFHGCNNMECLPPLGGLPKLRVMTLITMKSLKCFHDDDTNMLGDTTDRFLCLQKLTIYGCPNLVSLPSNLPKLKALSIDRCNELISLPDEIQSFKDLNELHISECKHLGERYQKEIGEDWPKISHIPSIFIYPRN